MSPLLSGKPLDEVKDPARTVLLYEVPLRKRGGLLRGLAIGGQERGRSVVLMADGGVRVVGTDGAVPRPSGR
jgi:hypothetical protein